MLQLSLVPVNSFDIPLIYRYLSRFSGINHFNISSILLHYLDSFRVFYSLLVATTLVCECFGLFHVTTLSHPTPFSPISLSPLSSLHL